MFEVALVESRFFLGLCPKSNLNTFYGWTYETIMDDGTYQFKGYVDSRFLKKFPQ